MHSGYHCQDVTQFKKQGHVGQVKLTLNNWWPKHSIIYIFYVHIIYDFDPLK